MIGANSEGGRAELEKPRGAYCTNWVTTDPATSSARLPPSPLGEGEGSAQLDRCGGKRGGKRSEGEGEEQRANHVLSSTYAEWIASIRNTAANVQKIDTPMRAARRRTASGLS